jgi:hypothetical protein
VLGVDDTALNLPSLTWPDNAIAWGKLLAPYARFDTKPYSRYGAGDGLLGKVALGGT